MKSKYLQTQSVNAGSMSDIAFLLLIFFLVSTTILKEKGLMMQLPPPPEDRTTAPVNDRNLFKILINSQNELLVQNTVRQDVSGLRAEIMHFVMNNGEDPNSSTSPQKATISIKTNRGTSYGKFIEVLDEVKAGYYQIYAQKAGITPTIYRQLDLNKPSEKQIYQQGKAGVPMNISIAEPNI